MDVVGCALNGVSRLDVVFWTVAGNGGIGVLRNLNVTVVIAGVVRPICGVVNPTQHAHSHSRIDDDDYDDDDDNDDDDTNREFTLCDRQWK